MFSKKLPFDGQEPIHIYEKILDGKTSYALFTNAVLKGLIRRLLKLDIEERLIDSKLIKSHKYFKDLDW